jgi:XFP-like protein
VGRANNYLTVGQIYLMANPLLREPLATEHIKPRLLGHWGTSPGLALVYAGAPFGQSGSTNTIRVHRLGEPWAERGNSQREDRCRITR